MNIEIWSVGKENEAFIEAGVQHYFKKIKPWCAIEMKLLQQPKKLVTNDVARLKTLEGDMILKALQPAHHLLLLDEKGKLQTSEVWASQIQHLMTHSVKTLVFLIGGAFGVSEDVKAQAKQTWALSPLVFPHQLVRLIVAEQIFRSFSILNNTPYHHA